MVKNVNTVDYAGLKISLVNALKRDWGPRCEVKDIVDFPDLINGDNCSRCQCCLVYEKFDDFWEYFDYENSQVIS